MKYMTGSLALSIRNIGRAVGLNRLVSKIISSDHYEEKFERGMLNLIQDGDVIWDIGANVGLYTEKFLDQVGSSGQVCAFEPAPGAVQILVDRFKGKENVRILSYAMGDVDGEVEMLLDENDPASVVNKIIDAKSDVRGKMVKVRTANSVVISGEVPLPNVIKIDVEGYELSVVKGMEPLLVNDNLRCVAIEVHFGLLNDRNEGFAPKEIEHTLTKCGFCVKWTDPSHIVASRK